MFAKKKEGGSKMRMKKEKRKKAAAVIAVLSFIIAMIVCLFVVIGKSSIKTEAAEGEKYYKSIVIEKGDSLYSIAEEYGCTVDELIEINGLESNMIYAGENLIVSYTK